MAKRKNLSAPKRGMDRTTHPSQLENTQYTFLLNGNTENEVGETLNITNEPSNYLAVTFPVGYEVVGFKKHPVKNKTYYFLTNEETGFSSIGYVDNIVSLEFEQDSQETCLDCTNRSILPTPLEETTQTPYNTYVELFNDLCNKDLNFSINFPIKFIVIKTDKLGTKIYWVDNYNPDRWFDENNLEYFKTIGSDSCGEDTTQTVCVNVDRMRQQPEYMLPTITPEVIQIGGNLRMGSYQFRIAYCDITGNEISDYTSPTQPVNIFDENNRVLQQTELDSFTNFGIRLDIENLDLKFPYYKVIVIERVVVNQAEGYFEVGIFPTSDKQIFHSSTQTGTENEGGITKRITYDKIISVKQRYEHSEGIVSSDNRLFKWGLTGKKFPNLQPIVNLIGGFFKWQSTVAKEGLYKDPIANALYRGYMREEVQPIAVEFFNRDGSKFPALPIIARPANYTDLQEIDSNDTNYKSISANGTKCSTTGRTKRWQLFNTATVEGVCSNFADSGTPVTAIESANCIVTPVDSINSGTISIVGNETITDVVEYINDNISDIINPSSDKYNEDIADILTNTYPDKNCIPIFASNCEGATLQNQYVEAQTVENQNLTNSYHESIGDYPNSIPPSVCQTYQTASDGTIQRDYDFQTTYGYTTIYKRQSNFLNENCVNALQIADNNTPNISGTPYFGKYYGASLAIGLYNTSVTGLSVATNFYNGLHTGALWFKATKNNRQKLLLEITQNSDCSTTDNLGTVPKLRYSIFSDCSSNTAIVSGVFDTSDGVLSIVNTSALPDTFYIVVESPIVSTPNSKYAVSPPCGCFSVYTRDLNLVSQQVTYTNLVFKKTQEYKAVCNYILPDVNECKPIPYQYGEFSYWESTDTYPDNKELYDSSELIIKTDDLSNLSDTQKLQFEQYYTSGITDNIYNLKDADFRCTPIRHPKMPSNAVSPFMGTMETAPFAGSLIFPLGITIDNDVINTFLYIAVKNNLLTEEQREQIAGYRILKGENILHKSIITNAIGFDMYKYTEKDHEVLYANYPLNDLGDDILHQENGHNVKHPFDGAKNYNFSTLSPEFSLNHPTVPSEIVISGYQKGDSKVYFADVDNHPKWIIMTSKAKDTANILAGLEVALEVAIQTATLIVNSGIGQSFAFIGTSSGTNAVGTGLSFGALSFYTGAQLVSGVYKYGQYRLQWLETIRNLGQPRNYSSYSAVEGFHNTFLINDVQDSLLRGISASKYLKAGRYTFKDEHNGDSIYVNNFDREQSTFISTGKEYPVNYPPNYTLYDNTNSGDGAGSRTVLSKVGGVQYVENLRKTAVPYITFKNFIANQFGTIDSIKWIDTSYQKFLTDTTQCETIFGGTVFICRDYQKRKHPIYSKNAYGEPNLTRFNYSNYKNVATPTLFVDYEKGSTTDSFGSVLFPDIDTQHGLDNVTRDGFYYTEDSKFYLWYYGVASYLTETEVNTDFRYGGTQIKDQFYPLIQGDLIQYTQEKNLSIKEPNTYYYNSVYSRGVSQTPYTTQPVNYNRAIFDKINNAPNGITRSLVDSSENNLSDPWLIYKTLDRIELSTEFGRLISLEDLGSAVLLARMDNKELLLNSINSLQKQMNPIAVEIGTGDVFDGRIIYSEAGTQSSDYAKTKYGYFSVDAKRGVIYQRSGQDSPSPISDVIQGKPSGLKNWFRQQLPFKILRQFPNADIDNKFKGLGITIGVDNKLDRIFFTKKDYIVKPTPCLQYDEELGFVINETLCGQEPVINCPDGFTYNPDTQLCEKSVITNRCPDGYTYNPVNGKCEQTASINLCPSGYTYNSVKGLCEGVGTDCQQGLDLVFILDATYSQQSAINNVKNALTSTILPSIQTKFGNNYRLGLVTVKDRRTAGQALFDILTPMSAGNVNDIQTQLATVVGEGGNNVAEPSDLALAAVLNNTTSIDLNGNPVGSITVGTFRSDAAKAIMFVTDAPPSGYNDDFEYSDWLRLKTLSSQAATSEIQIFTYNTEYTTFLPLEPTNPISTDRFFKLFGTSGEAALRVGDTTYNTTFTISLTQTAANFVTAHAAQILAETGATVTSEQEYIYLDTPTYTVIDSHTLSGNLGGQISKDYQRNHVYMMQYLASQTGGTYTYKAYGIGVSDGIVDNISNNIVCVNTISPADCNGCVVVGNLCNCVSTIDAAPCNGCEQTASQCICFETLSPEINDVLTPVSFDNQDIFEDCSWTIAYKPTMGEWVGYYSFTPNMYVPNDMYFQTYFRGGNLWSHLMKMDSFQVFQGVRYPFIVEYPIVNENAAKIMETVSVNSEVKRWQNNWDYNLHNIMGFDSAIIYNHNNNSGQIELVQQKTLNDNRNYPQITTNSQKILYTSKQGEHTFNYFFNRVKDINNGLVLFINDVNNIGKELNLQALSFTGKRTLERIRGEYALVRLANTKESRMGIVLKQSISDENTDS